MVIGHTLKFPIPISGKSSGFFDGQKFSAPITGRYEIALYLNIYSGVGPYHYLVEMKRTASARRIGIMSASGTRHSSNQFDNRHFSTKVHLQKNDNIYFQIGGHSSGIRYNKDSFVEGRLIQVQ